MISRTIELLLDHQCNYNYIFSVRHDNLDFVTYLWILVRDTTSEILHSKNKCYANAERPEGIEGKDNFAKIQAQIM